MCRRLVEKASLAVAASPDSSGSERPADGVATLHQLLADDLKRVNQVIVNRMQSPVALIPQVAGHIVAAGGKRLRPLLTLASARMCGHAGERHINLAAAVEFIHTATLLHDDVVDESTLRRGLDTANAVWGNKASVLVGDFLFSRSFQLMVADGSIRVLKILSDASAVISEGEVHQLLTANNTKTTEADYMHVIEAKTAALFAAACEIGAVVAQRPDAEAEALSRFGRGLGIAFQLVDDVLDYSAEQQALGKTVGDDFREGKVTLPIVLAFNRGDAREQAFWRRTIEDLEQTEADLPHAMTLLEKHGCLRETLDRAERYVADAREAMSVFPDSPTKQALLATLESSLERSA
jgi:octaprenyl-diphosphate synthase